MQQRYALSICNTHGRAQKHCVRAVLCCVIRPTREASSSNSQHINQMTPEPAPVKNRCHCHSCVRTTLIQKMCNVQEPSPFFSCVCMYVLFSIFIHSQFSQCAHFSCVGEFVFTVHKCHVVNASLPAHTCHMHAQIEQSELTNSTQVLHAANDLFCCALTNRLSRAADVWRARAQISSLQDPTETPPHKSRSHCAPEMAGAQELLLAFICGLVCVAFVYMFVSDDKDVTKAIEDSERQTLIKLRKAAATKNMDDPD